MSVFRHWHLKKDEDQILWLAFDRADATVNTINPEVLQELNQIIENINQDENVKGLIIYSEKNSGFIAGAEIDAFTKMSPDEVMAFIKLGQQVFANLASLKVPTLALINGFCLGGGLELALACDYRIAEDDPKVKLGAPEVLLGFQPGWGGSVRLPHLLGAPKAMDMLLTGRNINARAAKKIGLVDEILPKRELERAARYYINNKPSLHQANYLERLSNFDLVRPILAKLFRKKLAAKVNPKHYPAPYTIVDTWETNGVNSAQAFVAERNSIEQLLTHDSVKNLIRVFFLRQGLKNTAKTDLPKMQHVHVEGAGVMGGDIAAWCALRGFTVTLHDNRPNALASAFGRACKLFEKKLASSGQRFVQAAKDRLILDWKGDGVYSADIIIEAIVEELQAKQELFRQLEQRANPNAIFATNTSSIELAAIGKALQQPERLAGLHFFNPVAKMPLVEVVQGSLTSEDVVQRTLAFVNNLDKLPLLVKDSPGFLVNRALMPYLLEAMKMLNEGIPAPIIDKAAVQFGMPMGPIELADTVGLDICLHVAENLTKHFGGTIPQQLRDMVAAGQLGRKTGQGFYQYDSKGKLKPMPQPPQGNYNLPDLAKRLIDKMINECKACLQEHIVANADRIDAGMIFGAGFAPFRGGPLWYAEHNK